MRKLNGWKVLAAGMLSVVLGQVYRNNGGLTAGADLLTGNGAIVLALGAGLVGFGNRARFGGEAEWRNRALGAALGVALSAVWRGAVEIAHAPGSGMAAWLSTAFATVMLLVPAVFCWAYVGATFLKRPVPGPMRVGSESPTSATRAFRLAQARGREGSAA